MVLILNFLILVFKTFLLSIFIFFYYVLISLYKFIFIFIFSPVSIIKLLKSLINLFVQLIINFVFFIKNKITLIFIFIYRYYVFEAWTQVFFHLSYLNLLYTKIIWRYYFYRRVYKFFFNIRILLKAILTVEPNALLIKHLVQPLESLSAKFLWVISSPTKIGYRFRVLRRLIKFFTGIFSLFYFLQLLIRIGVWYFSLYFVSFLKFLRRKQILENKIIFKFLLKFVIWLKLLFVWNAVPFDFLFKPGVSKKYPQYEDMQPNLKSVKSEVWDFALARDCYFDEDDVLNGYYIFHIVRKPSKFIFNFLIISFVFLYLIFINFLYIVQIIFFLIYVPFKFLFLPAIFTTIFLTIKLTFVLMYLMPVLVFLFLFIILYIIYQFCVSKFNFFFSQKILVFSFISLKIYFFKDLFFRFNSFYCYLAFKIRSLNYIVFSNIQRFYSINNLFSLNSKIKNILNSSFGVNSYYANLLYYNSSFVFKRLNPYYLRLNKKQFLNNFLDANFFFRFTPDQIKSLNQIGLNSKYPLYYFERLFDLEYSKVEIEYETLYYWSFVRQVYSNNQGILHPKFYVYGITNFIKFYWNYFSFLSNYSTFEFSSVYAHDFIQLLNSSSSQIFSLLMNDFFELIKVKKLFFRNTISNNGISSDKNSYTYYFKLTTSVFFSEWHFSPTKYYDKLIHFFWGYFDTSLVRLILYYYFIMSKPLFTVVHSFFNDYSEKVHYMIKWFIFSFYQRLIGKIFINVNRFEDYYDMNFDKSIDKYDFYLTHLKRFFGIASYTRSLNQKVGLNKVFSENVKTSVRFTEYTNRVLAQRKKDYMDTMSDFFSGSFSFFGRFYLFVNENIFEFTAFMHEVWRDYVDDSATKWSNFKKSIIFLFYFMKSLLFILLSILLAALFFIFFLIKKISVIIIIKIKKFYV